ncbi:MAG: 50S ribosomal protein L18 [Parcubacteria group bacterium]|nr:50S ribosomal protein L18 [Parcubacteria group bacterium]
MDANKIKQNKKFRRKGRVRAKVSGTAACPRLSVFRSNRGIYAQIINDEIGRTLAAVDAGEVNPVKSGSAGPDSNREFNGVKAKSKKIAMSLELGKIIAAKARAQGISRVVFDRNGYKYHGRVKALAEGARAQGLKF